MTKRPEQLSVVVAQWLRESLPGLSLGRSASIHLDALLPTVEASPLEAYSALVAECDASTLEAVAPILVVPLAPADQIDTRVADWDSTDEAPSEEPPSLCLVLRATFTMLEVAEEFRSPIRVPPLEAGEARLYAYYRCFRTGEAVEHKWEFERALYLEAYPSRLVPP